MIKLIGPAGNYQMGIDALNNGADEIYVGLSNWSLRSPCFEMNINDLTHLHQYAETNNKKVLVCLNTLPWENDLGLFDNEIERLINIGIRSFVLLDIANIHYIKQKYKDIFIQASVGCDVRNIEDAKILESLGSSSITLSCPSPDFVKEIKTKTNLKAVIFAYGYLNYTYRTRCYMSSYLRHSYIPGAFNKNEISGSFNREGYCNRACKCHWILNSNRRHIKHITMNSYPFLAIDELHALLEAGADSIKIQGREYSNDIVKEAIILYRRILNSYQEYQSDFAINPYQKKKAIIIEKQRHNEMQKRTGVMIKEMLGVDQNPTHSKA